MLCNFFSPFQVTTDSVHPPDLNSSAKGSITALSVGSYVDNSALSISKDSLEEGKLFIHISYLVYFQFKGG